MAQKKRANQGAAAPPKRLKVSLEDKVMITHDPRNIVPQNKKLFTGMQGRVKATSGTSVDVTFDLPRGDLVLYQHFLKTAADTSCTVKFSTTQAGRATAVEVRAINGAAATPFNLAAVQSQLGRLLHPPWLMVLWRAGRNVVRNQTLVDCLCASVRRLMQLPHFRFQQQRRKVGWGKCTLLQRLAYAAVRDEVLAHIFVTQRTLNMLTVLGARYDGVIIAALLQYKQALARRRSNCDFCDLQIRYFIDEGRKQPRRAYGVTALVRTFGGQPHFACWRWLQNILIDLHRLLCAEAPAKSGDGPVARTLRGALAHDAVRFSLACIDNISVFRDPQVAVGYIADVLAVIRCEDPSVFRRLIKLMGEGAGVVELQTHWWATEPVMLGRDIAAAWDLFVTLFDIQGFACGAILLRLIPLQALWPVAESLMGGGLNTSRVVAASGYPKTPTHFFFHVLLTLIQRDASLEPFIVERFLSCGAAEFQWFHRCLTEARKPARAPEPYAAPMTRGRKRCRE